MYNLLGEISIGLPESPPCSFFLILFKFSLLIFEVFATVEAYDKKFYDMQLNASSISDPEKYKKEILDIQKISSEKQFVIIVGDIPTVFAFRNNVHGFESNPVGSMYYRKMWKN